MKETELIDVEMSEFIKHIRKDTDMSGLSLPEQEALRRRIERKNSAYDRRFVRMLIWGGSVAASICILLLAGWYMFSSSPTATVDYFSVMQSFDAVADTPGDVQLVLSNSRTITIAGEEAQIDFREDEWQEMNKNAKTEDKADEKPVFNQLVVPAGRRSTLTLNDGTKVWINSGSKLVFPAEFDKHKREVFVEGEVFLDVTHDAEKPFIVHTQAIDVKVLGTQFNVSAYADRSDLQVVLVSGEVEIRKDGAAKEILKPNQMLTYHEESHDFAVTVVDVEDYTAWKDGYYVFYSQDLSAVFGKLSKYYNVQFQCDDKLKKLVCSGKLDLKDDLQDVLKSLKKAAPTIEIINITEREYNVIIKP